MHDIVILVRQCSLNATSPRCVVRRRVRARRAPSYSSCPRRRLSTFPIRGVRVWVQSLGQRERKGRAGFQGQEVNVDLFQKRGARACGGVRCACEHACPGRAVVRSPKSAPRRSREPKERRAYVEGEVHVMVRRVPRDSRHCSHTSQLSPQTESERETDRGQTSCRLGRRR